jgi:recombinational DNA repair protein RecT
MTMTSQQAESVNWEARLKGAQFQQDVKALWPNNAEPLNIERFVGGAIRALYAPTKAAETLYNASGVKEALLEGAEAGLYTDDQAGEFDLVVYSGLAQMQISYRGWMTKAMRTKRFAYISTMPIYKNDKINAFNIGHPPALDITPALGEPGELLAYVAYGVMVDGKGMYPPLMMRIRQIFDDCRAHSKGYKYYAKMKSEGKTISPPPWVTHEDAMCRKSILIRFCKQFADMNSDAALTRDEYRESGVEARQSRVAQDPPTAPQARTESEPPQNHPPASTPATQSEPAAPPAVDTRPDRTATPTTPADENERQRYSDANEDAPAQEPIAEPNEAEMKLIHAEATAVFREYIGFKVDEGATADKAKNYFRDTFFPRDKRGQLAKKTVTSLLYAEIWDIIDRISVEYGKASRNPPVFSQWYKNHLNNESQAEPSEGVPF